MKYRARYIIIIGGFVLCLAMALIVRRQTRRVQSQQVALTGASLAEFTSLEPIDAHTHVTRFGPAFVGMLERLHMHVLVILYVDDTDPNHVGMEPQKQNALKFMSSSMGHAQLCTTFDPFQFNNANFAEEAIKALDQDFAKGAVAAKIWKNIGMEIKNASGQYVMPDDPRLEPIYKNIAAHDKTLIAHVAEPDAAWGSQDPTVSNRKYYEEHPQWNMSRNPDAPQKNALLQARDHLVAMNPKLRVVGAHFGSMEDRLDDLAVRFDLYPNFAVDTAARMPTVVLQPRAKVRAFILKYQDRILYGTDRHFYEGPADQAMASSWEKQYALDWRYFSTGDTFEYQGHKVEGLDLPLTVLKKLYHDNAVRWIPGIDGAPH
jgi:predicted TIM-barrel fold metal-dependent hydrolase